MLGEGWGGVEERKGEERRGGRVNKTMISAALGVTNITVYSFSELVDNTTKHHVSLRPRVSPPTQSAIAPLQTLISP